MITKYYNIGNYEQTVKYTDNLIYYIDCTCADFKHRRMYNDGNQKCFATPCKHLKPIIIIAEDQGLTLRKPKPMTGTDKCTTELRKFIMERSNGSCEAIGCKNLGHEIHKIIPKTKGGKYNKDNCVLLCIPHHKLITYQKWHGSPGTKK